MIRSLLVCVLLAIARGTIAGASPSLPLFESDEVLDLTLQVDFDALCRPGESPDCDFTPTVLEYEDPDGATVSLPVDIRRRDGWRAQQTNCQVPTLFVRFSGTATAGTPFEGQPTLALTSHCGKGVAAGGAHPVELPSEFERYVVNEYLGYRLYSLFTEYSLRVRLARIRYVDPEQPRRAITRDAFFSEHFESLAARVGAELVPKERFDPERLDPEAADRLALFQYMIGNTDWAIETQNNTIVLEMPDGRQVPVLYDLDLSGLVNAHYARPASDLPIRSVTQRIYLGHCRPRTDWEALFNEFADQKPAVMKMLAATPGLGRGDRRMTGVYLDSFFRLLASPARRTREIVNACRHGSRKHGGVAAR